MNQLHIRLNPEDAKEIKSNLVHLSRTLGYKLNLSDLLRHVLKNLKSKHSLYDIGYISKTDLHSNAVFKRGVKEVILKPRRMSK